MTVFVLVYSLGELVANVALPALAEKTLAEKIVEWPD